MDPPAGMERVDVPVDVMNILGLTSDSSTRQILFVDPNDSRNYSMVEIDDESMVFEGDEDIVRESGFGTYIYGPAKRNVKRRHEERSECSYDRKNGFTKQRRRNTMTISSELTVPFKLKRLKRCDEPERLAEDPCDARRSFVLSFPNLLSGDPKRVEMVKRMLLAVFNALEQYEIDDHVRNVIEMAIECAVKKSVSLSNKITSVKGPARSKLFRRRFDYVFGILKGSTLSLKK
ncbi:hypothetical protein EGW08_020741 [Elysia chlorotica]|uniref:Uncharacterized protein n=1 Tax=Elysia chlorotica TaxID=188477 RepID=A0A3S1AT93_ELYCH|nr:hypothetical protein EGW08_020741 [Elysia chlorotica]